MTIIEAVKTFIKTYGPLTNATIMVDYLGEEPIQYAIIPLPGTRVLERYITSGSLREFPFAFQAMASTADELERLETNGFFEAFADWLETQTEAGALPVLAAGKTAERVEAVNAGYIMQQGESSTAVYQVTCRLEYSQT